MISLQGHLLVSSPELPDVFEHSVVLLVRHNQDGAFGLILNRPSTTAVQDIWSKVSEAECLTNERLHVGGPVEGPLMALHNNSNVMEIEVIPGVYFSANREMLEQLAVDEAAAARYFIGYAGWAPGQLEGEIRGGSWQTLPVRFEHVFNSDESLWELSRREINDHILRAQLHIKHNPPDPRMN